MTQKPKKQLFNRYLLLLTLLLIPSIGFFVYAGHRSSFYSVIILTFSAILFILVPLHNRLVQKRARAQLQEQDYLEKLNLLQAQIQKEEELVDSCYKKILNYSRLKGLTERLSMCLSLEDTSETLSAEVNKLFGGGKTTVILYLFDQESGDLGIASSLRGEMQVNIKSKKGDVFDQWVVKTMQPLLIEDTKSDFRFDIEKMGDEDKRDVRSLVSVPLVIEGRALGILRADSHTPNFFTAEDFRFLTTIGDLGAIAIENAQLYERVEDLAIKDSLTGLYLRRYLLDRMPGEMSRQLRRKGHLSFMMIDLDNFKKYNDKFGHMAGDIVLKTIGTVLTGMFRDMGAFLCRYGGEEFSVMVTDCPKDKAMKLAEQFRKEVENQIIVLRRKKTRITVSIGIATFPGDAQVKEELIHRADNALYAAKHKGRNCVVSV